MTSLHDDRPVAGDPVPFPPPGKGAPGEAPGDGPADLARELEAPGPTPSAARPTGRRRRPGLIGLAVGLIGLFAGAALFLSGYSLGARIATTPGTPAEERALFAPFWDAYHSITNTYVGEVDPAALVQGAIDGMFDALGDPYSGYMTPEELRAARQSLGGQFEGIGAEITTRTAATGEACSPLGPDCQLVVVAPLAGSPAEKAGLEAGDVLLAVDGAGLDGLTLDDAINKVRGPKGTTVVLTVRRGEAEPFELEIVRDVIVSSQVEFRALAGGSVGYLRVAAFSDNSAAEVRKTLAELAAKGTTKVILDLRDNPGGYVVAARSIASQFIAEGPVFWEEDSQGNQEPTNAEPGGTMTDPSYRVVVLVNKGSASASEILAGALQDTGRATLVGETTFGKGTVQAWTDLSAEAGGFRLTIAKWLTPDKRWIHEKGLTPDVRVAADAAAGESGDAYIDAALDVLGGTASRPTLLRVA
jgi:carboxyl-terminal processing protease